MNIDAVVYRSMLCDALGSGCVVYVSSAGRGDAFIALCAALSHGLVTLPSDCSLCLHSPSFLEDDRKQRRKRSSIFFRKKKVRQYHHRCVFVPGPVCQFCCNFLLYVFSIMASGLNLPLPS